MIHILYADVQPLNDDKIFQHFYNNVSEERQNKINSFRFRKDKNLSLGASVLLDEGLKKYYGLREKNMTYGSRKNKKPYFINAPEIFFNVTHSETMAAVVFSGGEIGIDIEKINGADLKIAKRFFAEEEYNHILSAENQSKEFYRLWTLKESFMKVTGLGLQLPLNQFCIKFNENKIYADCDVIKDKLYFYENNSVDGYCLSVCSGSEIINPDFGCIEFQKG